MLGLENEQGMKSEAEHDEYGRLASLHASAEESVQIHYDAAGLPLTMVYPDYEQHMGWDAKGR